jgi:hypothetical protein
MKVYDLRNMITMEPVMSDPVQTDAGLLNMGFYQAFKERHGLLGWKNEANPKQLLADDRVWSRLVILSGGTRSQVIRYNPDKVHSSSFYADDGDIDKIIAPPNTLICIIWRHFAVGIS